MMKCHLWIGTSRKMNKTLAQTHAFVVGYLDHLAHIGAVL
jgi:hypothetical protein